MDDSLPSAYWECFHSQAGKQVLEDLLYRYYDRFLFDPNDVTGQPLAYREGQRSVVQDILLIRKSTQEGDEPLPMTNEEPTN